MLSGIRLFKDQMATDMTESKALMFNRDYIDIYSNSWGPDDRGFLVKGPGRATQATLEEGAKEARWQYALFVLWQRAFKRHVYGKRQAVAFRLPSRIIASWPKAWRINNSVYSIHRKSVFFSQQLFYGKRCIEAYSCTIPYECNS